MHVTYRDRTNSAVAHEYRLSITDPANVEERHEVIREMIRRGAKFPGNAAGWRVVGTEWEPVRKGTECRSGGSIVTGSIHVRSVGCELADGSTPGDYTTTLLVFLD